MPRTGVVNYHVHKPERQAFEIDADGIVGNLVSPELVSTRVTIQDAREDGKPISFARDGIAFETRPSAVRDFANGNWQLTYDAELSELLREKLGVKEVIVFDHTVREDDPNSDRKPARNVHSDYSTEGAEKRLVDILGADRAAE